MASPFGVRFFTRGYERTSREMSSIEKKAKGISTGFVRMGKESAGVGPKIARGLGILRGGLTTTFGAMKMFLGLVLRVTVALGAVGTVVAGVGAALITKFAKGLMATRENFYLIETAMMGIVKNAGQVRKISDWAMGYAAEFPAMYGDVMGAMKGLAMMPSLKPIFTKASVVDMEKIMNIVQSLAAMDPAQGVRGALFAMREALAGQWRSLQMRFEIRPGDIAAAAGLTIQELKNMPDKAIEALDAFVKLNVGTETLRKSALSLGVQYGNLTDRYEIWLNTVAQYGAYKKLVNFLKTMNDLWDKILKGGAAKKLGQDISRVFEAVIESVENIITGIDWEGKGIFGGLIEAGREIINKLGELFADAKEFLAASLELAVIYMKNALIFSVREIFWPVGVEIAKAIGDAFMKTMGEHPMKFWMASMAAGFVKGGVKGALVTGGISAVGLAGMEAGRRMPTRRMTVEKEIATLEEELKTPERVEFWKAGGVEEATKRLKKLREELVKLKETETVGGQLSKGVESASKKMGDEWDKLKAKWEEGLGPRKEIPEISTVEEQAKSLIEARIKLRVTELIGTKNQVETQKSQVAYQERLLDLHKKTAAWEIDPKRGVRVTKVKEEIKEIEDYMASFVKERPAEAEIALGPLTGFLAGKKKELEQLGKQKEIDIGDVTRYTGAELEKKALQTLEAQQNIKAKLLNTEKQIAKLRREGGQDLSQLPDLEKKLVDLSKQKLKIEQQYTNAKRQQVDIENRIQMMEMQRGRPGEIGLSALDQAKSQFQTFQKWMEKEPVKRRFGRAELPGMEGLTWGRAGRESAGYRTKGIPRFFLKQEEVLKEKLEKPDISVVAQKTILERLYRVNVDQFQMARGITAKGAQFQEANKFMKQLQDIDTQLQEEQIALAKEQAGNIARTVIEIQTTNKWLSGISSKTGVVPAAQSQPATLSSQGNQKITEANPVTAPAGIM